MRPSSSGEGTSATSQTVPVVPMFAPIITLIAWASVIMPADTKPTSMAVMIDEDWAISVETIPVPTPASLFAVARPMNLRSLSPSTA